MQFTPFLAFKVFRVITSLLELGLAKCTECSEGLNLGYFALYHYTFPFHDEPFGRQVT